MLRTLILTAVLANVFFIKSSTANETSDTDQCTGANEEYVKCPDCSPQTCDSIGKTYHCPLETDDNCEPACRCKSGYYRNANNVCISENDCQNQSQCKENEVYDECPNLCEPETCDQYGTVRFCPARYDANGVCLGKPACICRDDYLRNEKGVCIPKEKCTTCGEDPNAIPGCGINCNRHCSDYDKKDVACIELCKDNACDCKKNFVLDDNTGKCVKPKDCTPTCGTNEVYSNCVNGGCDKRNCTQYNDERICIDPLNCETGCVCTDGYLRAKNGTCIPQDQCPEANCKKNEEYVECPSAICRPRKCSEAGFDLNCSNNNDPCSDKPGCVCVAGYLRNAKGVCIPSKDCPSCGGDKNARPGCGVNCGKRCSTYKVKNPICILICNLNGCDCINDTVLDDNTGKCVPPDQCTCDTTTTTTPTPDSSCDD